MRNNSTWAPSALSPISWPPNAWQAWQTILIGLATAVLYVLGPALYLGVEVRAGIVRPHDIFANPAQLVVAQLFGYVPVAAFLLAMLPRISHTSLNGLGVRVPSARVLRTGALGTILMWGVVTIASAIIYKLTKRHDTENAIALLQHMKTPLEQIAFFALACVFAPIIEELIFRVFLFNALTRYVSVGTSIAVSGAIFGFVHALGAAPEQLVTVSIPLAFGGMVLAYVYATTRNYWANVTTHALFNSISVIAIFVFHAK